MSWRDARLIAAAVIVVSATSASLQEKASSVPLMETTGVVSPEASLPTPLSSSCSVANLGSRLRKVNGEISDLRSLTDDFPTVFLPV